MIRGIIRYSSLNTSDLYFLMVSVSSLRPSQESHGEVIVPNISNAAFIPISEDKSIEPSSNFLLTKFEGKIII